MPQNLVQPPPLQRTMMHRHHARKSTSSIAPKTEPGTGLPPPLQPHKTAPSPKNRPAPSSHSNSPNMASSAFSPAASDTMSMRGSISGLSRQQMTPISVTTPTSRQPMVQPGSRGAMNSGASFYPTPSFQNHIEQLGKEINRPRWMSVGALLCWMLTWCRTEQEYEADMVEDSEIETPSGPGPYPGGFNGEQQPMLLSPASTGPGHQVAPGSQYPSMTQLLDQQPDWDPFGLSASMAFPGQPFQFDQTHMR